MITLSKADIDRLEQAALAQYEKPICTPIAILPGELLALCAKARSADAELQAVVALAGEAKPA